MKVVREGKKEPTDDAGADVYAQLVNSKHVSGIIMPIVRRTDCIKPRVVLAWMCWLHTTAASTSRLTPHAVLYSLFS